MDKPGPEGLACWQGVLLSGEWAVGAGKPSFSLQGGVRLGEGVQASLPPKERLQTEEHTDIASPNEEVWGERRKPALDPQPLGTPVFWNVVLSTSNKGGGAKPFLTTLGVGGGSRCCEASALWASQVTWSSGRALELPQGRISASPLPRCVSYDSYISVAPLPHLLHGDNCTYFIRVVKSVFT